MPPVLTRFRLLLPLLFVILLVLLLFGIRYYQSATAPEIDGLHRKPTPLPTFQLQDDKGQVFTQDSLRGQWSLLFFGYTQCPDICPGTLSMLAQVKALLPEAKNTADSFQFRFISVDGQRDPPELLYEYVRYFDPAFTAATGSKAEIDKLAQALGIVYYRTIPDKAHPERYLIDHSASILLINPAAQRVATFQPPHLPEDMAQRLLAMRAYLARQQD
ncbi:SCO family protein [Candidatus Venteria ishoeyi]|uniref:SCO family protein n=1 Tax=Candidatus Venteria ishoeyi TaxID=1899563 RepID=UPI0025A5874D|nr:SCO family protein [Candidatus Venteria ishoeyi]MDM8548011.1 SCO family protein [Candidatus Venteria ishoeyi]